jgi:hypothetical protein
MVPKAASSACKFERRIGLLDEGLACFRDIVNSGEIGERPGVLLPILADHRFNLRQLGAFGGVRGGPEAAYGQACEQRCLDFHISSPS